MRPSLGVLITYYNEGELLTECLDSLLSGSVKPDEILIYDDASGDPAERYVKRHHPVRIIHGKENIGAGRARNELMRASACDLIHLHDADDLFDPRWCITVRETAAGDETDLILSNVLDMDPDSTDRALTPHYDFRELRSSKDLLHFFLAEYTTIMTPMTTYRRELALRAGGFLPRETLTCAEEYEFHMRLFSLGIKFHVLEEGLVIRRARPNSLSRDASLEIRPETFADGIKSLRLIKDWLPARYHPLLPDVLHRRGVGLFRKGRRGEARSAFRLAQKWGGPLYRKQPPAYRMLAGTFGPEFAEWVVHFYSRSIPSKLRSRIKSLTSNVLQ
jgi:glycosyltransferase involved in cell wall biosynthesis